MIKIGFKTIMAKVDVIAVMAVMAIRAVNSVMAEMALMVARCMFFASLN